MTTDLFAWPFAHLTDLAKQAEMHETPEWAPEAILDVELMTHTLTRRRSDGHRALLRQRPSDR